MTLLRKLEIGCGAITALLGITTAANMLKDYFESMRQLERNSSVAQSVLALLVALVMYVLPSLAVAFGSYLHASRRRAWGLPLVIISSLWLVIILMFWLSSAFFRASPFAWLNFSLATLAILTVIVSLVVSFSGRR